MKNFTVPITLLLIFTLNKDTLFSHGGVSHGKKRNLSDPREHQPRKSIPRRTYDILFFKIKLKGYFEGVKALANNDFKKAKKWFKTFKNELYWIRDGVARPKVELILSYLYLIEQANHIEEIREGLHDLSYRTFKLILRNETKIEDLVVYKCTNVAKGYGSDRNLKEGYWLSLTKEIKNPYYGSNMLTCGKKETYVVE